MQCLDKKASWLWSLPEMLHQTPFKKYEIIAIPQANCWIINVYRAGEILGYLLTIIWHIYKSQNLSWINECPKITAKLSSVSTTRSQWEKAIHSKKPIETLETTQQIIYFTLVFNLILNLDFRWMKTPLYSFPAEISSKFRCRVI